MYGISVVLSFAVIMSAQTASFAEVFELTE